MKIRFNKHIIFSVSFLISSMSYAQIKITDLHYRNDTLSTIFELNSSFHSSVKPYVLENNYINNTSKICLGSQSVCDGVVPKINSKVKIKKVSLYQIYPLVNLTTGLDNINSLIYTTGIGVGADYSKGNFYITGKFLPFYAKSNYNTDSIIEFASIYPGASREIASNTFFNSELIAAYKVNQFFTLLGGYGKNFFGDGYRSLLLSDNASANPFFKIETSFSSIKYVNLYQLWHDVYQPPNQPKANALKFSASHYLSWNITPDFNLSIFETIVMQGKDSLSNRKLDLNYLNPVVFYRPVEYGMGSADNVLLGINMSYKTIQNQQIYYQLILDEFLLSELKAKSKWWANKYGMQIGFKAKHFIIDDLYFQTEFNFVRPFTYSHKHSAQNYGHLNAPVAHPIGANFFEAIKILRYNKGKHNFTNKMSYSGYGIDSSVINYGQNIFHSYADRFGNYDHTIMQGLKVNVFNNQFIYEYALIPQINLYTTAQYNYRYSTSELDHTHNHTILIGIKSRIWNSYTDF